MIYLKIGFFFLYFVHFNHFLFCVFPLKTSVLFFLLFAYEKWSSLVVGTLWSPLRIVFTTDGANFFLPLFSMRKVEKRGHPSHIFLKENEKF